jgi:hypothetical protein
VFIYIYIQVVQAAKYSKKIVKAAEGINPRYVQ